jgi:HlyD family secretion protein
MKKTIIYIVVALALILAVYFIFFSDNSEEFSLRADKITEGDITVFVTATGEINAVTIVEVGSQISGTVSKLYADYNSIVKEGQIIAQIDPTNLQQTLKDAEANLEKGQAQFSESQRSFERVKGLYDKQLESRATYDLALTNVEVSRATLKQYQAQLERAKINLDYATIYAPINGVVIDRKVNVGQTVAASLSAPTLYTIANDLSKMQVQATVDESDIGKIAMGQEASFTVDAFTDTFSGKVSQIRLSPVIVSNVVNYTVVIDVANDKLKLMPGMTANIKVMVGKKTNVMKVPNIALRLQPEPNLVDTVKLKEMRDNFNRSGAQVQQDGNRTITTMNVPAEGENKGSSNDKPLQSSGEQQGSRNITDNRQQVEMRIKSAQQEDVKSKTEPQINKSDNNKFGITQRYPQYQKSSVLPTEEFNRGRIWIKNSNGKLEPIMVRTGLNDGQFTEIITDNLKVGDEIIVGVISNNPAKASASQGNPLMGGQQRPPGGGPGGARQVVGGPR